MQEMWVQSRGQEDPLEKEIATQYSVLAWEIPWTEAPGGLQSVGLREMIWLSDQTITTSVFSILLSFQTTFKVNPIIIN